MMALYNSEVWCVHRSPQAHGAGRVDGRVAGAAAHDPPPRRALRHRVARACMPCVSGHSSCRAAAAATRTSSHTSSRRPISAPSTPRSGRHARRGGSLPQLLASGGARMCERVRVRLEQAAVAVLCQVRMRVHFAMSNSTVVTDAQFEAALVVNSAIAAVALTVFLWLRPRVPHVFSPRVAAGAAVFVWRAAHASPADLAGNNLFIVIDLYMLPQHVLCEPPWYCGTATVTRRSGLSAPPPVPAGRWAWLGVVWHMTDREFVRTAGLDAAVLLMLCRFGAARASHNPPATPRRRAHVPGVRRVCAGSAAAHQRVRRQHAGRRRAGHVVAVQRGQGLAAAVGTRRWSLSAGRRGAPAAAEHVSPGLRACSHSAR